MQNHPEIQGVSSNRYIELVMEGGGVLGVALVGYTYVLEQMGLRFFSLAGTSAGSINALILASLGGISQPKTEKLTEIMANKNLYDFVDGGLLSNFPIDIFHKKNIVPRLPTFGVRLGVNRNSMNKITSPLNMFAAVFNSMRHLHDYDFILKNPDYSLLIQHIDIGSHDWLNFNLSEKAKIDLFKRGALAAAEFLRKFKWKEYKDVRKNLVGANVDVVG